MMLPKLVLTDIDGVWTDGSMYYDQTGNELKRFNTYDSAGVLFCRKLNIPVGIITGEETQIVQRRAEKLKVDYLFQGVKDKVKLVSDLLEKIDLSWQDVAYIGDDINDIGMLKKVGYSYCPSNAHDWIKSISQVELPVKGGDGAFRAMVEHILKACNKYDEIYNSL